ncbi:hypothetical protein Q3A91_02710 [Nocardia mangyaensis]|nr:hypothetical protein [Nocardia mangyaensis]MDO3645868.1 hypothetical protein [Nocardia mangyaensis]
MVLPRAGGFVTFEGAVADVFPFHPRQCGQHGEHHAGRIVGTLQFTGEKFQADVGGLELFGQGSEFDSAAETPSA